MRRGAQATLPSDVRWRSVSSARVSGGGGLLASLVIHGGVAAVIVMAAALTVGAPGPTVGLVEMVWIETSPTEALAETLSPPEASVADPMLAAAESPPDPVEPVADPPVPEPVEPESVIPEPPVPEPVVTRAEPEPNPEDVVERAPDKPPVPPVAAPPPPLPKPARPRVAVQRPGPSAEAATQVAASSPAPAPVVSPNWNAALAAWLHRNKTYPPAARSRGEQGSSQVRFTVARDGRVRAVELVGTTGSPILDEAVRHLLNGATVPAFPVDMPHAEVTVNVRINYSLRQGE